MRIVIAGGTGFLGSALARSLRVDGHEVRVLTRRPGTAADVAWDPPHEGPWTAVVAEADAIVNLAGEALDAGRWTRVRKQRILRSRVDATRALAAAIAGAPRQQVLLNASAVGIYGPHGDETLTEATPPAADFLASVCVAWEREAYEAGSRARVVLLRTGLVLDRAAGALPRLARSFQLFAGGPVGSGRQWWSWIHAGDWVRMVMWAIGNEHVAGPLNLTAPEPVTNGEFAATLGRVLRRPALVRAPGLALRLMLGEMADALILSGQRVIPQRALDAGFRFQLPTLELALRRLYRAD